MSIKKVKAGALQFSMFIVVVIALLLAAFIVLIHTYNRFKLQSYFVVKTIEYSNFGMNYALNRHSPFKENQEVSLAVLDDKLLELNRSHWGLFEMIKVKSKIKTNQFEKVAIVGSVNGTGERPALFLEDHNKPLVLVGKTKIEGSTFIPNQGVRTGNISGQSYYGSQMIYGDTRSSGKLPLLSKVTLHQIKSVSSQIKTASQDQFLDVSQSDIFKNSFYKPKQVIYNSGTINLSGKTLIGHISIQSQSKIIVDSSSHLEDVVLIAPEIEIKQNTKGKFQGFATKRIIVGNNSKLDYPTALVISESLPVGKNLDFSNTRREKETPNIKIGKESTLKGMLVYIGQTENFKSQVLIDDKATVIGEVYCNKNMELLGAVFGSVFTSNFIAHQGGSSYQNHIYNGTIICDSLPEVYAGLPIKGSKKRVMAWLY